MGCLKVTVQAVPLHDLQVITENKNDLSVTATNVNSGVTVTAKPKNVIPLVTLENKNTKLKVTVGLVCGIDLDMYEFLYVDEGPLMVEEGYLKVRKKTS